jgi:PKD repeat protein
MKIFTKIARQLPVSKRFALKCILGLSGLALVSPKASAQLSGTYTVCALGCNYSTIQKAADDLKSQGISGSVIISIKAGTYLEQVSLGTITGVSSTKTVTFKGAGSKNTDVLVSYKTGTCWSMKSSNYITLENMRIETQLSDTGVYALKVNSCSNINVVNCRLEAPIAIGYSFPNAAVSVQKNNDMQIKGCYVRGGCVGIQNTAGNSNKNLNIDGNYVTKSYYHGIEMVGGFNISYTNNTVDSANGTASQGCLYSKSDSGSLLMRGNTLLAGGNMAVSVEEPRKGSLVIIDSNFISASARGIYCLSQAQVKFIITRNRIRNQTFMGVILYVAGDLEVSNNMIDMAINAQYGLLAYPYSSLPEWKITHNTIYQPSSAGYAIYFENQNGLKNISIKNNLLAGATTLYNLNGLAKGNKIDGNNLAKASGVLAVINGTTYSSISTLQSILYGITGTGKNEQNTAVTFVNAPSDLHLSSTNPAPFGVPGLEKDIDGDLRCQLFPTVGADESKNTAGDNYKKITGTKFSAPSKSYIGTPTVFYNSASSSSRYLYRWYVNGKKVSDSSHLSTTALTYPKSCVKLEAYNCSYVDSYSVCITIDSPSTAPTADFISNKTTATLGDTVHFTDLSTGYPAAWSWEITPETVVVDNKTVSAYKYIYGDNQSSNPAVLFTAPGKYKVCLTSSNVKGKSSQECRVDYIEVHPAITLKTGTQVSTAPTGYIYDNGGPQGNTVSAFVFNPLPNLLIDACADSVYLVFKAFDINCANEYVRVFQGKNSSGTLLTCNTNQSGAYGPGLTGSATKTSCVQNCPPIHKTSSTGVFTYDTFKAAKYMYIEMMSNSWGSPGFEAYYWIKPAKTTKPKASFTSADSVCVNEKVYFTNTTSGADLKIFWDLDGVTSTIEETAVSPGYAYLKPGKYTVTLFVSNCGGLDSFSKTIVVFMPKKPVAAFKADNTTPAIGDHVFFSPDMTMCADAYAWTITPNGNGGKPVYVNGTKNTSANPEVTFDSLGCYDVTFYTKNAAGEDTVIMPCYIKVRGQSCKPTVTNKAADLGISKVVFNKINNTTPQGLFAYTSYVNDPTQSTSVQHGELHELTVSRITNNNKITRAAWIDWNIDGIFDTTERVGLEVNSPSLSWTTKIRVPKTAKEGATVMRIGSNMGTQTNLVCGPNAYGEYEDYRIYVTKDITKPVLALIGNDSMTIDMCEDYKDSGATAFDNVNGNLTSQITTASTPAFDNTLAGTYVWKFSVSDSSGNVAEANRVITILQDKTPPEIVFVDPEEDTIFTEVSVALGKDSVAAFDCGSSTPMAVTKTGSVDINVVGAYELEYSAADKAGNIAKRKRVVMVEDKIVPVITLKGSGTVIVEVHTKFTDAGVTVLDNYYSAAELLALLEIDNPVDTGKLGVYTVTYSLTDPSGNGPVTVTRTVLVVDVRPPVITLAGDNPYYIDGNTTYSEPGVTVTDNHDKTIKYDITGTFYTNFFNGFANKLGTYTIVYTAEDISDNKTSVTRTIIVQDTTRPVVNLVGQPTITICRWQTYIDAGADISDNFDPNSALIIEKEGTFIPDGTQKAGLFNMRYKATDKSGNVGYSAYRGILVQEPNTGPCVTGFSDNGNLDKLITVFPNPTSGKVMVNLNLPSAEPVKITVTNSLGQRVAGMDTGLLYAGAFAIDLSTEAAGVYLINVQTATKSITKKVILAR